MSLLWIVTRSTVQSPLDHSPWDGVGDCLKKDPSDRTKEDIEILMEFTHTLDAFTDMTHAVR